MMAEWHLPPDYILNNWTDELLNLMVEKLAERKKREAQPRSTGGSDTHRVSDTELFRLLGKKIEVVRQ